MRPVERMYEARVELVTAAFVASGRPEGVHDLGRFLETLNNPTVSGEIELRDAAVRPLYRSTTRLELGAPLVVRRADIIFAAFEGPHMTRGAVPPPSVDVPVLVMSSPFQVQGTAALPAGADAAQALRNIACGFFVVRDASVFDADGNHLGDGEHIVLNGPLAQMFSPSGKHIAAEAPLASPAPVAGDEAAAPGPRAIRQIRAA